MGEKFFLALVFMTNQLELFNGIYNLDKRLKKIDSGYNLYFDRSEGKFYLYVTRGLQKQKELCLGTKVDAGIIKKIRATRKENMAKIFEMIEKNNQKLEENAFFDMLDKTKQIAREVIDYADKKSYDLSEEDISKIING